MRIATVILAAAFFHLHIARLIAGESEIARFRREYPNAAAELEAKFSQIHGNCRITDWQGKTSNRSASVNGTFASGHGYLKLALDFGKPKVAHAPRELVYCANKESIFKLEKLGDNEKFVVAAAGSNEDELAEFDDRFGTFFVAPYSAFSEPISKLIKNKKFVIIDAESVVVGESRLLQLRYKVGEPPEDQGTVLFDPQAGWVIKHFELIPGAAKGEKFIYDIKYDRKSQENFFPTSVEVKTSFRHSKCEFIDIDRSPLPVGEFTMEHYSLPDLLKPAEQPGRFRILRWFGIFGVVVGFGIFLLMAVARGKKA